MGIIIFRKYDNKIEAVSDNIVVRDGLILNSVINQFKCSKMILLHDLVLIGGVGNSVEINAFFEYTRGSKIVSPKVLSEEDIYFHIFNFKDWFKQNRNRETNYTFNSQFIIAHKFEGKMFVIWTKDNSTLEIDKYYAIGKGYQIAMGAMYMGASPQKAIDAVLTFVEHVKDPIISYTLNLT